jgi:hypothetical protein
MKFTPTKEVMKQVKRKPSIFNEYEQYRSQIKSGDVIAFSGKEGFSSLIKWATRSIYSHVGIVLEVEMGGGFGKSLLVVESTTSIGYTDADGKEVIKGVQINWLSKRLDMYDGEVWLVPLKEKLAKDSLERMQTWLRQTNNKKLRYDSYQPLGSGLDLWDNVLGLTNKADLSRLFCSELVTAALQVAGVLNNPEINASEQTPRDVVNFPCFVNPPVLLKADSSAKSNRAKTDTTQLEVGVTKVKIESERGKTELTKVDATLTTES